MAQVTMDSKEYIELLDKARAWDKFNEHLVQDTQVSISEDHYRGYKVETAFGYTEKAKAEVTINVGKTLAASDDVMKYLVREHCTLLDLQTGYVGRNWDYCKPHEVDLMKVPEFKTKYEAISAELEEEA